MITKKTTALLSGVALTTGAYLLYKNMQNNNNNPEVIRGVIQNWVDTVCRHNADDIVSLYAPDGVLLGTVAKTMKVGQNNIIGYFDMFVGKKPCGYITDMNVQNFGSDYAVADGTYTFELTNEDGGVDIVPARYTFVLRRINGEWKIATHHSSVNPE
jgi:uncharacterized protein (TIGR02246 family)|tara:strand:+ start:317 stop:787 length:471 start_codon:yes stop_codon:yes gene_type:complete